MVQVYYFESFPQQQIMNYQTMTIGWGLQLTLGQKVDAHVETS